MAFIGMLQDAGLVLDHIAAVLGAEIDRRLADAEATGPRRASSRKHRVPAPHCGCARVHA